MNPLTCVGNIIQHPLRPLQGRLDNVHCALDAPLTGRVRVEECEAKIRSVEVQLIRVETIQVRLLFVSKNHYIEDVSPSE